MALWHLTINRMDWIPFDHHHLSDSLVFFPTCLLSVAATSPHLLYTLLPDSFLCIRCCLSTAVQTDAAVVSWRSIGIHSHMTAGEWWIIAGRHQRWRSEGGGGKEREREIETKKRRRSPAALYMRACVRASIQSTYRNRYVHCFLLFAIQRHRNMDFLFFFFSVFGDQVLLNRNRNRNMDRYASLHHH